MIELTMPYKEKASNGIVIKSFINDFEQNIDWESVNSFGNEWARFNSFNEHEIVLIGNDYFDLVKSDILNPESTVALDVGCGSGRWDKFLSERVKFIEAIDPSKSAFIAANYLKEHKNIRVSQASVDNIPFPDNTFDFVFSLGVLHHLPDTESAITNCYNKLKSKGWFLIYLYYNLENRNFILKGLFYTSSLMRILISRMPQKIKIIICDLIAIFVYFPLAKSAKFISLVSTKLSRQIPLNYYSKTSFTIMRNDALDRFGTPLEKRFSKADIENMLIKAGFKNITFSDNAPYWHAIAQKV